MKETSESGVGLETIVTKQIRYTIDIISQYTFWESKCFVKAIAGMKMLERRKIDSTLYLGTAKSEDGDMVAHAWLRSGNIIITGRENMNRFTVVSYFAKHTAGYKGEQNEKAF